MLGKAFAGVLAEFAPDPEQPKVIRLGGQHSQHTQLAQARAVRPVVRSSSPLSREAAEFGLDISDEFSQAGPGPGSADSHVTIEGGARPLPGVRELQIEDVSGPQHLYVGPGAKPVDSTPPHRFVGVQPPRPHPIAGGREFVPTRSPQEAVAQAQSEGAIGGPDPGASDPVAGRLRQLEQELNELRATLRGAHRPREAQVRPQAQAGPPPQPVSDPWSSAYPEIPEDPAPAFTVSASQAAALEKLLNSPRVRSADQLLATIQESLGASLGGVALELTTAELEAVRRRAVFMGIPLKLALRQMVEAVREGLLGAPLQASMPAAHHEAANALTRWNGQAAGQAQAARPASLGISVG